jgi:hypothetical protein
MDPNELQKWAEEEAAGHHDPANAETSYDKMIADFVVRFRRAYERGKQDAHKKADGAIVPGLEKGDTEGPRMEDMSRLFPEHYRR